MLIVDSQIHLWANATMGRPHRQVPTYAAADALREMAEAGVDAAVIHPPTSLHERAEEVNELAVEAVRRHPEKFCILGYFDLERSDRRDVVKTWRQRRGMVGFRFGFSRPEWQHRWADDYWLWAACEEEGLPVGLLGGGRMAEVAAIAARYPGLKLHIDHCGRGGVPGKDDAVFADLGDLLDLARYPNVAVKLSGAPSYSSQPYPYRNIHPYLRQIYDAFGPQRCFWGTDITRMPCSYRQCVTMFTEELPWLHGQDLELVMGEAICAWLGWRPRS